jgi:hypothetical protein
MRTIVRECWSERGLIKGHPRRRTHQFTRSRGNPIDYISFARRIVLTSFHYGITGRRLTSTHDPTPLREQSRGGGRRH